MAHARQAVREAVVAALQGLLTTGSNVFDSPRYPLPEARMPALNVFVAREGEANDSEDPEMGEVEERVLAVVVEAKVKATQAGSLAANQLDAVCAEAETALKTDAALAALCSDLRLVDTVLEIGGDLEEPVGTATMTWSLTYMTIGANPTTVVT